MNTADGTALVLIATGPYWRYVNPLIASMRKHLKLPGRIVPIVLTDNSDGTVDGIKLFTLHLGWPQVMLQRYRIILQEDILDGFETLICQDVDMEYVEDITFPIDKLFATTSPCQPSAMDELWCRVDGSRAYTSPRESDGHSYCTGSLFGGPRDAVYDLLRQCQENIDHDLEYGIVNRRFPEEAHLNRYFLDHEHQTLSMGYCYPEKTYIQPDHPRILTLSHPYLDAEKR